MTEKIYVLYRHANTGYGPYGPNLVPLTLDGFDSEREAGEAARHYAINSGPGTYYALCRRVGHWTFAPLDEYNTRRLAVRGPHSDYAWARFIAEWDGDQPVGGKVDPHARVAEAIQLINQTGDDLECELGFRPTPDQILAHLTAKHDKEQS